MTRAEKFSKFADTDGVRQNLKRKSVRGVLFMVSAQGIDLVIRLASTFLLARLLSPTEFGLVAMVFSVTAIAEQISEFGLSTATIQCRELSHPQVTNLFWINFGAGCLLSLLICGLAPGIASFYRNPELLPMTLLISTTFIWGGLTVQHQALLSRQMKQAHMGTIRLSASFLSVVVAIILAINHLGVWALAWREVARAFFVALGMWLFCRWIPGWPRRNAAIGELLRYGSHLTLNQLAIACFSQLDRLLMGRSFRGERVRNVSAGATVSHVSGRAHQHTNLQCGVALAQHLASRSCPLSAILPTNCPGDWTGNDAHRPLYRYLC